MAGWARVRWSEASQVLDLVGGPVEERPTAVGPPADYFAGLRTQGRRGEAVDFLAQALPRLEAVAWAARTVRDLAPPPSHSAQRTRALRAALFWVQDPTDARRRAAFEAAEACDPKGPEAMAAYAAFFSGGSIGPAETAPIPAPKQVSGHLAAGAVKAVVLKDRTGAAFDRALDAGEALAREGIGAA